jgi:hypothetical protein
MNSPTCPRRDFLRLAGLFTASWAAPGRLDAADPSAAGRRPGFEISASLYAWDLHDEGIERILDNLQEMAILNSVYLIVLMHYVLGLFSDLTANYDVDYVQTCTRIALECGVNGITLGHYDGAEFPMLSAIREGLAAARVPVPPARTKARPTRD